MFRRSVHRFVACTPTLQAIISGTAAIGGSTCSRMPPATAEKAKPTNPETNAPANTARLSQRNDPTSCIRSYSAGPTGASGNKQV